jgi:hypothetical protein
VWRYALLLLFVFVLTAASAQAPGGKQLQTAFCPNTAQLEVSPSNTYWFEGLLGQKRMRMYLERGGAGVVGVYYDTADWVPMILGGRWTGESEIAVSALSMRDAVAGTFKGHLTARGFEGMWTPGGEENGIAFQLKSMAQPKCDGSGAWKSFQDGHWPVSFSYPASWHVSASGDSVTLTCPDPSLMAYEGYEITVMQGADANNATTDFVQCGEKWIYGSECKCENATRCKAAPAEERGGLTILKADEMEWKNYCRGGGYVGLGAGERRVITFGDSWVAVEGQGPVAELVVRVVGTMKRKGKW